MISYIMADLKKDDSDLNGRNNRANDKEVISSPKRKFRCFVIMPFTVRENDLAKYHNDTNHWNEVYHGLVKPAVEKAGLYCDRNDEDVSTRLITDKIWQKIETSEIVLCDLSSYNPNVFLELGWTLRANKKFILIKDNHTEFSFDLHQLFTFEYSSLLQPIALNKGINKLHKVIIETINDKQMNYSFIKRLTSSIDFFEKKVNMRGELLDLINEKEKFIKKIDKINESLLQEKNPNQRAKLDKEKSSLFNLCDKLQFDIDKIYTSDTN